MATWILLAVVAGAALALFALLFGVVTVVFFLRWKRVDPVAARADGLVSLGYASRPDGTWARPIQGTTMVFEETPDGLRWQMLLPRYNTMTLDLQEAGAAKPTGETFTAGISEIDARFVLASPQADRVVALLKQPKLQKALLRTPRIDLQLSADELILQDPGRAGVEAFAHLGPVEAELTMHALVFNVVNALFGSLYSETGTVLDQFR